MKIEKRNTKGSTAAICSMSRPFSCRHSGARPKAASPESIIPARRSMDSGLAASRHPGMTIEMQRPQPSSSRRRLGLEIRMHHRAVAGEHGRLDQFVVPVDRERLFFLVDQGVEEGQQILGIERGGGSREPAWHVEIADDAHIADLRYLARPRAFDIAAALDCEIDDHRAWPHR